MARKKPSRTKKKAKKQREPSVIRTWWREMDPERRAVLLRCVVWVVALTGITIGGVWGLKRLEPHVLVRSAEKPVELGVRLVGRPDWMPRAVMERIGRDMVGQRTDYHDRNLTRDVYERAEADPWIRSVNRVRKYRDGKSGLGIVEIDAEYRRPIARAGVGGRYHYVDTDGVRLPDSEVPLYVADVPDAVGGPRRKFVTDPAAVPSGWSIRQLHYIVVELHEEFDPPAPAVGEPWNSGALEAGLKLVRRILDEPYAEEITVVDVRNHRNREISNEPELTMFAQAGRHRPTRILFGRFPEQGGDFVIPPERKFDYLDGFFSDHGRLTGLASELDLRHDNLLVIPY